MLQSGNRVWFSLWCSLWLTFFYVLVGSGINAELSSSSSSQPPIYKVNFFTVSYEAIFTILRHGDRSPTWFYQNDPFKNPINWPEGVGSLNERGIERLKTAGSIYQSLYGTFLNQTNGWPLFAKSSPSERCQKSATIFLESFRNLPSEGNNGLFQVEVDGPMLSTASDCPASSQAWLQMIETPLVRNYMEQKRTIILELQNHTGEPFLSQQPFTLRNLEFLATTLEIERDEYRLKVPAWARDAIIMSELNDLKRHAYWFDWSTATVQRLRSGLMLKDIQKNMYKFVDSVNTMGNIGSVYRDLMNGKDNLNQRFFLYSTHDVVQVVLLQALDLYDVIGRWPTDYSAAIVFELLKVDISANEQSQSFDSFKREPKFQHLIRIVYRKIERRIDLDTPRYIHRDIPLIRNNTRLFTEFNCTTTVDSEEFFCTVEQFSAAIEPLIPKDWAAECLGHGNGSNNNLHQQQSFFLTMTYISLITLSLKMLIVL